MMNSEMITRKLRAIVGPDGFFEQEMMAKHTTFHVGGPARYYVLPSSAAEIKAVISLCLDCEMPWLVIGNGSNLLVSDKGYNGVVIEIGKAMSRVEIDGMVVRAEAGVRLSQLSAAAAEAGLSGLEFASGIPGNLGGAIFMNAGAYGGEMKQVVTEVELLTRDGDVKTYRGDEMAFGYRHSLVETMGAVVLSATMQLSERPMAEIKAVMADLQVKRMEKQPLNYPSAGSTFKRPEGYFAGKLVMDAGLSGYTVGGAQVSEKHCGFVINRGGATADDIYRLMRDVSEKVEAVYHVTLEPEVRLIGDFS